MAALPEGGRRFRIFCMPAASYLTPFRSRLTLIWPAASHRPRLAGKNAGWREAEMAQRRRQRDTRKDLYSEVTDKIIAELEQGHAPWSAALGRVDSATPLGLPENGQPGGVIPESISCFYGARRLSKAVPANAGSPSSRRCRLAGASARASAAPRLSMPDRYPESRARARPRDGRSARHSAVSETLYCVQCRPVRQLPEALTANAPDLPERRIIPAPKR